MNIKELDKLCIKYVEVNSYGKLSGVKKSQIHSQICDILATDSEKTSSEIHDETQAVTDNLDIQLLMPILRELSDKELKIYGRKLRERLLQFV
jgi:hypothetical protein